MKVAVINNSRHALPQYKTSQAAGMDICACIDTAIVLQPLQRQLIPTGIFIEMPIGMEAQIRPRSGMAFKQGITVLNSPGTIDSDYRGEIKILLINLSNENQIVNDGDRIAQIVFANHLQINWEQVIQLTETNRGDGGYGSTGVSG